MESLDNISELLAKVSHAVVKVDSQNRIRIPNRVGSKVSWLAAAAGSVSCLGLVGPRGGMQVLSPRDVEKHEEALARLSARPVSAQSADLAWVDYLRHFASAWELRIRIESGTGSTQFSLTLPKGARSLGVVPSWKPDRDFYAVVLVADQLMEIYSTEAWLQRRIESARNLDGIRNVVLEEDAT